MVEYNCTKYLDKFVDNSTECEFRFEYLKDLVVCIYNNENLMFDELGSCEERIKTILQSLVGVKAQDVLKNKKPHKQRANPRNRNRKVIKPEEELEEVSKILQTLQAIH